MNPKSRAWLVLARATTLLACVAVLAIPTRRVHASEKVDVSSFPGPIRGAIGKYQSKSRACLDKLVGIIEKGSERSVSEWESQCDIAEGQLVELSRQEGITTVAGKWLLDEISAWSRMASIGRGICMINELLVRQIVHLQWCRAQTEQERKLVGDRVRDVVRAVLTDTGSEARDVLNVAQRYTKAIDKLGLTGAEGYREIVTVSGSLDDEVYQVTKMEKRAATAEKYIYLMADSLRRRKTRFLKDNDRLLSRIRQDLARLVSAKIDPDGRGVYTQYENRIERAAEKNLDEYEEELDKWKAANKTFLGNARDFGTAFVDPAVEGGTALVPYGGQILAFYRITKAAGSLVKALDPFLLSVRHEARRMSEDYYKEMVKHLGDYDASLRELADEKDVALLKLKKQRERDATDFDVVSKQEIKDLKNDLRTLQAKLDGLAEDDEKREALEEAIDTVEQRIRAEPIALKRRHERYKKKTEAMLAELAKDFDERIAMMKKRRDETVRIGGEIKKVK